MCLLPVLVLEISELSPEEEAHSWEVVNYPSHAFPELVTPEHLQQCRFRPDPCSSLFYPSPLCFFLFFLFCLAVFSLFLPFISTFLCLLSFLLLYFLYN